MVALIRLLRSRERIAALEQALSPRTRPGRDPGAARAPPGDLQPGHQRAEGQRVVALPGAGQPGQRPAPGVGQQVDLAGQPAPRPAQRLAIFVIRLGP